jgi:hypothetical protein
MAAVGDTILVSISTRAAILGHWDHGQVEHPGIVTGLHSDPNIVSVQVFQRDYGPVAKIATHQDVPGAAERGPTWREKP